MTTVTLRADKGSALTNNELDNNFKSLVNGKQEVSDTLTSISSLQGGGLLQLDTNLNASILETSDSILSNSNSTIATSNAVYKLKQTLDNEVDNLETQISNYLPLTGGTIKSDVFYYNYNYSTYYSPYIQFQTKIAHENNYYIRTQAHSSDSNSIEYMFKIKDSNGVNTYKFSGDGTITTPNGTVLTDAGGNIPSNVYYYGSKYGSYFSPKIYYQTEITHENNYSIASYAHSSDSNSIEYVLGVTGENGVKEYKFSDNGNALARSGSWINASDIRKKSNVIPTFNYLQYLKAIQPITFIMEGKKGLGFSAQQVQQSLPNAVWIVGKGVDKDGNEIDDQLGLDYGSMTAALWQICKEQQDIIDNMTSRLEALEDK